MSGRRVGREAGWERVAYDIMRPKALRKRDEMAGAGAEAEGGQESEAEGVPLTCAICQQFKDNTQPSKPSLVPIDALSSRIFGQVGIDFMTDLPLSEGFDSIMVAVDHGLRKGVILTPCSKTGLTAEHTA